MGESDKVPAVGDGRMGKIQYPWWVDQLKWVLAQFLFPVAVCGFLLWNYHTVGKSMVETLAQVREALVELRESVKKGGKYE